MGERLVRISKTIVLAMPVAEFWRAISDTDQLNRATGLPAIRFTPVSDNGPVSHLTAKARFLGVPVDWDEKPFEWSEEQYFWVERLFKGFVGRICQAVVTGAKMRPLGEDSCEAELFADFRVNLLGQVAANAIVGRVFLSRMVAACRKFERNYRIYKQTPEDGATMFAATTLIKPRIHTRRLHVLTSALRRYPVAGKLVDRLVAHLSTAPDDAVEEMRPFALADEWGSNRMETLRLFLYATRAGLLDMSWEVLCPNCRVAKATYDSLIELKPEAHCDTCNIRYDVNFDEYVELRFKVSAQVRGATNTTYCIGGPFVTRHIVVQVRLAAGENTSISPHLAEGSYRIRLRQLSGYILVRTTPGAIMQETGITFEDAPLDYEPINIAPGDPTFHLTNHSGQELLVIFEQDSWDNKGVTAALATSLQEFRTAFSSQVLSPGVSVAVRNLTFLFSDLKNSTGMYQRTGDPLAYARVRDHFVIIREIVVQHDGSLVKTMGDAVMAVFAKPEQAIAAAIAIQSAINEGNRAALPDDQLCVKMGLHAGPCLAVTANETLDYFGSTVNIAARLLGVSIGGDIVITETMLGYTEVRDQIAELVSEPFQTKLKGLDNQFDLYRVLPNSEEATGGPDATP